MIIHNPNYNSHAQLYSYSEENELHEKRSQLTHT